VLGIIVAMKLCWRGQNSDPKKDGFLQKEGEEPESWGPYTIAPCTSTDLKKVNRDLPVWGRENRGTNEP